MAHRLISFFMLGLVSLFLLQDLTRYALFKLNQPTLVEEHCLSRDQENNHCQASCYFERELTQATSQADQPLIPEKERIPFPLSDEVPETFKGWAPSNNHFSLYKPLGLLLGFFRDPFRPPISKGFFTSLV